MDKNVGALTRAVDFSDDSLLLVEQQGEAKSLEGVQLKNYIRGVAIESSDGGDGTGVSGTMDHSKLMNRSAEDQHPASSIAFSNSKTDFVSDTVQGALEEIGHDLSILPGIGGVGGNVLRLPGGGDAEVDPAFGGPPYTFTFTPATDGESGGGATGSVEAKDVGYNNTTAGLLSSNVQDAIDELSQSVDDLIAGGGGTESGPVVAKDVGYNNAETSLSSVNVQDAINELSRSVDNLSTGGGGNTGTVEAEDVGYSNAATGLASANVQGAIDELFQSVSNGKALVASAITDKGIPTAADATFQAMAENIAQISGSGSADFTNYEWAMFSPTGNYGIRVSLDFTGIPEPSFAFCVSYDPFGGWELCPSDGAFIYYISINIGETNRYRVFYTDSTGKIEGAAFTLVRPITFENGKLTIPSWEMTGVPPLYFCGYYQLFCLVKKT